MTVEQTDLFKECPFLKTGRQLRDQKMEQVEDNSGDWKEIAKLEADRWFEELQADQIFTGETVRTAIEASTGEPHHHNAWSAVIGGRLRVWLRCGWIELAGIGLAKKPSSHAGARRKYRKIK